jgi:hypothetical protein
MKQWPYAVTQFPGSIVFFKLLLLTVICMSHAQTSHGQVKDSIFMKDGTILSGELKALKSGRIEFDIDNISIVKIKYDKIKMIRGVSHAYRIETSDRKIYYGYLRRTDVPGTVKVDMKDSIATIPIHNISTLTSLNSKSLRTINGYISSGFNYARSSKAGRFNLDGVMHIQLQRMNTDVTGNMFISQTDSTWVRDRESFSLNSFYILNPWFSLGGTLKYQRNFELGLARRFQEGVGLAVNLLNNNNFQIRTLSGVVVNQEKSTEGIEFPTQVEIPFQLYLEYFKFSKPNISVITTQSAYFSLTDAGRVRWDGETRISWEIIEDLAFSLQVYHNYDNRPPSGNERKWDYGTVFGLKYQF